MVHKPILLDTLGSVSAAYFDTLRNVVQSAHTIIQSFETWDEMMFVH